MIKKKQVKDSLKNELDINDTFQNLRQVAKDLQNFVDFAKCKMLGI